MSANESMMSPPGTHMRWGQIEKAWPLIPVKHPGPICSANRGKAGQEYGLAPGPYISWRRIGSTGNGVEVS